MSTQLWSAVKLHLQYEARLNRPEGTFDRAGRWYPAAGEVRSCCRVVRHPSRAHPYSYYRHCFTLKHIAQRFDLDPAVLRRAVRRIRKAEAYNA